MKGDRKWDGRLEKETEGDRHTDRNRQTDVTPPNVRQKSKISVYIHLNKNDDSQIPPVYLSRSFQII